MGEGSGWDEAFGLFSHFVGIEEGALRADTRFVDVQVDWSTLEQLLRIFDRSYTGIKASDDSRGTPLNESDFRAKVTMLQREFQEALESLSQRQQTRQRVAQAFPRYQIGIVGPAGAGKSTTARWLAYYAGLKTATRSAFGVAGTGSMSYTRSLVSRGMSEDHNNSTFVIFDTMGMDTTANSVLNSEFASTDLFMVD